MDQVLIDEDVIIIMRGNIGCITLNRPKALNALNLDMIRQIRFALEKWQHQKNVKAVYIDGAGERAFCAGGDIKAFYRAGMDYRRGNIALDTAMVFFKEEYELNEFIFNYPKPIIAHMHGITMGGGYGIGGNARHRIISYDVRFAMPEVKIGFVPDVGSMYHLTRAKDRLGHYLAVSGDTIAAGDMLKAGLADFAINIDRKEDVIRHLNNALKDIDLEQCQSVVQACLKDLCNGNEKLFFILSEEMSQQIEEIFEGESWIGVYQNLLDCDQLRNQAAAMSRNCPFAMAFSFDLYRKSCGLEFSQIIANDYLVCRYFIQRKDFYEGIRSVVIDKDKMPAWENFDITNGVEVDATSVLQGE